MSKCTECVFEYSQYGAKCYSCQFNPVKMVEMQFLENNYEELKPTRFEQFREQTATIDGLVEFCFENTQCITCDHHYKRDCEINEYSILDAPPEIAYCKAGIKAYWEGIEE